MLFTALLCSMSKMSEMVMIYCSISISTNEMSAFGVIQSHDILGHMVKCYYAIGSVRFWTYFMISRIHTMKTLKGTLR